MDEATANIDLYTEKIIQDLIQEEFEDCTVIKIAHRLNTIVSSTKILVIENGRVAYTMKLAEDGCIRFQEIRKRRMHLSWVLGIL